LIARSEANDRDADRERYEVLVIFKMGRLPHGKYLWLTVGPKNLPVFALAR
jgi:hypothetical protein